MNILEAEDMVKGLPDQVLFQYAQNPPPNIPQYLAVSEVQRRQDMRQRFQAQQQGMEPTVKDQVLQGGIASAGGMPPEGMPMEAPMEPPMGPPQGPPQGMPQGMPMSRGGITRMAGGGLTPGGIVYMQQGGTLLSGSADPIAELERVKREALAKGDIGTAQAAEFQLNQFRNEQQSLNPVSTLSTQELLSIPESLRSSEQTKQINQAYPGYMSMVPGMLPSIQGMLKAPAEFDEAAYIRAFQPSSAMFMSPDFDEKRKAFQETLREEAKNRRTSDIALAEKYRSESELPIQAAQDEARRTAIASTLMRLGSGLAAGDPAQGLASASQAVENIMTRAREQAAAERRAVRQEFRAAERDAIRSERASADQIFNMQSQAMFADEAAQRQFALANSQFAQGLFNARRAAGESRDKAYNDSVGIALQVAKNIDDSIRLALREAGLTERQYVDATQKIYIATLAEASKGSNIVDGKPVPLTPEEVADIADRKTQEIIEKLRERGAEFRSEALNPNSGMKEGDKVDGFVVEYQGQKFRFNSQENADRFKAALESI